jgi:hypothetical protein
VARHRVDLSGEGFCSDQDALASIKSKNQV